LCSLPFGFGQALLLRVRLPFMLLHKLCAESRKHQSSKPTPGVVTSFSGFGLCLIYISFTWSVQGMHSYFLFFHSLSAQQGICSWKLYTDNIQLNTIIIAHGVTAC
jgi:hypothetical protein